MSLPRSLDERLHRVRRAMRKEELAALIVSAPADCRYLTGFTGEAQAVALTRTDVAVVSDSRFTVQAAAEIPGTRLLLAEGGRDDPLREFLKEALGQGAGPVGIDTSHLTVKRWERLRTVLDEEHLESSLVEGLVERARRTKLPDELESMRVAGWLAASAFAYLETIPVVGRTERDVALDLEMHLRRNGSEGVAFPFIVASGERGAMPHGEASDAVIEPNTLVVFDIGAVVEGYASDITRTYATGPLDAELLDAYESVRIAQAEAVRAVRAGLSCKELDAIARGRLADAGLGEFFVHSLGHGVGLEVHEAPGVSARSEDVLEEGMVVTVEPGVYLPGRAGVRIEDSVVVGSDAVEILTECPRELRQLC